MIFILRVFQITVWRIRAERLSGIALAAKHGFYLFAGVLGVEFVENIDEWRHVIINLILAVHTIVNGDKANIMRREYHLRIHANLKVIPTKAAHILYDDDADSVFINKAGKPLPIQS